MAIVNFPTGIASTGPNEVTQAPFGGTGSVFWVDSVTGSDSNAGTERKKPKATIFGASGGLSLTTNSSGDVVFVEKTHRETVSSAYTWAKIGVWLVSLGTSGDRCILTSAVAGVFITVTGVNNRFINFSLPSATAATTAKVSVTTGNGFYLRGCAFEAGASDQTDQVLISGADNCRIASTTFKVVAAAGAGTTQVGLTVTGAAIGNWFEDLSFDGGSFGWSQAAMSIEDATADDWSIERLTLSNNSYLDVTASGSNGMISGITADASSGWNIVD